MPDNTYNLTIYLTNLGLNHDSIISKKHLRQYRNWDIGQQRYHVYAKSRHNQLPKWEPFFESRLNEEFVWPNSGPGLVLLLDVDDRTFALIFGHGKHILETDCWEDRFGLKVVLNTIDKVKSLKKKSFDAILGQTQTDASTFADVDEFGFDVERDILRAATGQPGEGETDAFGERLTGSDALVISVPVDLASLPDLLRKCLRQAELTKYKEKFEFVDHLRAIDSPTVKAQLDGRLVELVRTRIDELAAHTVTPGFPFDLAVPQVMEWEKVSAFGYGIDRRKDPERHDITIDTFLPYLAGKSRGTISVDSIKRAEILALDGDGSEKYRWSAYRCFSGELEVNGKKYVLSDKLWYQVSKDYVEELEKEIAAIPTYPTAFPNYAGGIEKKYNESVRDSIDGFYCLDGKMIRPMTRQKIEYCDLYTENHNRRDLIHVKHGTSSAVLSHLFAQGTTSAEVVTLHDVCRQQADDMVKTAIGIPAFEAPGRPTKIRVVYGIIRSKAGRLPFFSKVNLKRALRDLKLANTEYALAEIEYDPAYRVAR